MAIFIDDAGETSGNVPRPRSYSGNDHAYNGLWTSCVPVAKVVMDDSEMDGWVFALGRRRRLLGLQKEHFDLATYCPGAPIPIHHLSNCEFISFGGSSYSRSSTVSGGATGSGDSSVSIGGNTGSGGSKTAASSDAFCVLSESSEVTAALLNPKVSMERKL
ncbi:unnamed protein product [Protopolystoma xenopodis]|uniref:Uncharacterized protein n=1 Tax=Protopolystoma xenopodis TaxID=117903 RepID=A0A448XDH2_9PLAT|nr:unnamed protein product [Protopolystoma xenopodis]